MKAAGSGRRATGALALLALLAVGCASLPTRRGSARPAPSPSADGRDATLGQPVRQYLYRLTYDGGEGRTSLRVVLRRVDDDRFQLAAADIAGRAVFGLDYSSGTSLLVDHREGLYCVGGPGLRLAQVHPTELPLAALPRVLRGELPVPLAGLERAGEVDDALVDATGRRWRVARDDERLVGWTLLDEVGPALWWTRREDGGILSRRGGEQYRWSLIVAEDADAPLGDIVPDGFAEGVCDEPRPE